MHRCVPRRVAVDNFLVPLMLPDRRPARNGPDIRSAGLLPATIIHTSHAPAAMTSIIDTGLNKGRYNASAAAAVLDTPMPASVPISESGTPLFTCMSCAVAFMGAVEQRDHYRSELHRYNMKRRVANLPPVKADIFNAKIQEHAAAAQANYDTQDQAAAKCAPCGKSFASENAYRGHLVSKKHQQVLAKTGKKAGTTPSMSSDPPLVFRVPAPVAEAPSEPTQSKPQPVALPQPTLPVHSNIKDAFLFVPEDASEAEVQNALKERLSAAQRIDASKVCMFCKKDFSASEGEEDGIKTHLLQHLSKVHSFFIPEQTYLVDKKGLLQYLADKIYIAHMCIWCNARSKAFSSTDAVQGHMHNKGHCRIAYNSEPDQLELGDFYDFSTSYPDAELYERKKAERAARRAAKAARKGLKTSGEKGEWQAEDAAAGEEGEWEDEDVEMEEGTDSNSDSDSDLSDSDLSDQEGGVRLGDTDYELVLPSGTRIGHRTMRRYYNQRGMDENGIQGSDLARRLLPAPRGRKQTPAPDDGAGGELTLTDRGGNHMVVRNRGEARAAKKAQIVEGDRQAQRFNLKVGITHNQQKHFRAQYLQ